jgi:hypothetical protein
MLQPSISDADLQAYLDETLTEGRSIEIEQAVRADSALAERLAQWIRQRDSGVHSVGEIWRRHRLSCPGRETLQLFLLRRLPADQERHLQLHLITLGCIYCLSNLDDLRRATNQPEVAAPRRQRYYRQSVDRLRPPPKSS